MEHTIYHMRRNAQFVWALPISLCPFVAVILFLLVCLFIFYSHPDSLVHTNDLHDMTIDTFG